MAGASSTANSVSQELAAVLRPYDPLEPRRDRSSRWLLVLSALIHLGLLGLFWDALIGIVIEEEETVTVRMLEEKPQLKRKVLAQRRIDTSVRRFKDIVQPEVRKFKPVQVLDQAFKVELDPTRVTEAPKQIQQRQIVARTVNAFADVVRPLEPLEIDKVSPAPKQVASAKETAGPRELEAASPTVTTRAADVEAPNVARGVASRHAVAGDTEGARIAALESGTADDRFLHERGGHGLVRSDRDCMKDPVCREYLEMIRDRVYARWNVGSETQPGKVRLRFRIDRGGSAHQISIQFADDKLLGETCLLAFRHASPFPPPPKEIHYLVNKGIIATFDYGLSP